VFVKLANHHCTESHSLELPRIEDQNLYDDTEYAYTLVLDDYAMMESKMPCFFMVGVV
jgi:hypothetical protein